MTDRANRHSATPAGGRRTHPHPTQGHPTQGHRTQAHRTGALRMGALRTGALRTRALRRALLAGAALLLAACSGGLTPEGQDTAAQFAGLDRILRDRLPGVIPGPAAPAPGDLPPLIVVDAPAATGPALDAAIASRGARATLAVSGTNADVVTWQSPDAVSLALLGPGVLIATRGLGTDLHAADAAASATALARGTPQRVRRVHRHIGGDQRLADRVHDCTIALAGPETVQIGTTARRTQRFEERCEDGPGGPGFVNIYWRDPSRPVIWQSQQWVDPEIGHIRLQLLRE